METIYNILSQEHRIVLGMFEEAMTHGSKEVLFRIKAEIDPHMAGKRNFTIQCLRRKKNHATLLVEPISNITKQKALMYELRVWTRVVRIGLPDSVN